MMKLFIGMGGLFGGLSVLLGAFGAHSLKGQLAPEKLTAFNTATHYMSTHSMALIIVGILSLQLGEAYADKLKQVGWLFAAGIVLFCGSIYALSLGGPKFFGPFTPLGGLSFMIGWFSLAFTFIKKG